MIFKFEKISCLLYFPDTPEQITYLMNYTHFAQMHYSPPPTPLTLQSSIIGISSFSENSLLLNHLVLIFRYYVYNTREDGNFSIELVKRLRHNKKWSTINFILD